MISSLMKRLLNLYQPYTLNTTSLCPSLLYTVYQYVLLVHLAFLGVLYTISKHFDLCYLWYIGITLSFASVCLSVQMACKHNSLMSGRTNVNVHEEG